MDHAHAGGALYAAGRGPQNRGVHPEALAGRHRPRLWQLQDRSLPADQVGQNRQLK